MYRDIKKTPLAAVLIAFSIFLALSSPVSAEDEWISVSSKNFFLISNAKEKDARAAAEKLEQFREAFKLLFPNARFDQAIPTNVVVFKDRDSYKPFKPKRDDGKPDEGLAGYFQPGEDANYITFSTERSDEETFGTIFHEYVHFIVDTTFGESQIPPWFNEGLAEYYQTIEIDGRKINLGKPQGSHLYVLNNTKLIPFDQFFSVDNYSLHRNSSDTRTVFYAQAWALVHYLISSKQDSKMSQFLTSVLDGREPETAFKGAFGMSYPEMEKELQKYVRQRSFSYRTITLSRDLDFDSTMAVRPISESETNAYLGDLLYHIREYDDAAAYLQKALASDPDNTLANTSLGMIYMNKRNFELAKRYLERAVAANRSNHRAQYSYAYALSRESMDEFGYVSAFPASSAAKMRDALKASIEAEPAFAPSYQLLAFINLVNGEDLEGALEYIAKGLRVKPGNAELELLQAKIYLRQEKYDEAERIARKVEKTASEESFRSDARQILGTVSSYRENLERIRNNIAATTGSEGDPILLKRSEITQEEIDRLNMENLINRLHMELPTLAPGEVMIEGRLENIACEASGPRYTVNADGRILNLVSDDFTGLQLLTLDEKGIAVEVGCDADLSEVRTIFTYQPGARNSEGTLLSMTFVPDFFRLKTPEEIARTRPVVIVEDQPGPRTTVEFDERRRTSMMEALRRSLRKPAAGEIRVLAKLSKIECGRKYTAYVVEAGGRKLTLRNDPDVTVHIITYTPEVQGIQFGCGFGPLDALAIVTYRSTNDKKLDGNIVAIEFVPSSFTFND
ncbi:MAG: DUF1570 domain-containing protein [Acidobacteria bacterium]|nr:MAG: DUF1570 domain-containing protein [Acidobacteriota bacterium]REJ98701.1 MAG: DUF1570 domain-containing protein [Acidobacteriota bacterium]REK16644.1 MAG: DUF1570 domain-containing protein [Acidobacteriota bacterium]REK42555.1 MAG: DUF1570 domain-containing protein [Acidobacteriota bacterium]